MKRFSVIFLVVFLCYMFLHASAADLDRKTLRIGLYYGTNALPSANLQNVEVSESGYQVGYMNGYNFVKLGSIGAQKITMNFRSGSYCITDTDSGNVLYQYVGEHLAIHPNGKLTWFKGYQYYGDFLYRADSSGNLTVINYVEIEDYVKGVIPYEISPTWNVEAQKAQAIAARSYALGTLNKHQSYGFDLCNTTNCQVYRGASRATAVSDAAVEATAGQYLSYNGQLITGYFFSSDGGATEDARNVWGTDFPYYRGVLDPYEDLDTAYNGRWSVTLTPEEIAVKLKSAGKSIGTVASVTVTKRTAMDNVNEVTVTDTSGNSVSVNQGACRTVFGLNSIRYKISGGTSESGPVYINGTAVEASGLYAVGADGSKRAVGSTEGCVALTGSGKQTITLTKSSASPNFTFSGTGWGHSVGLSQYGAKGMAEAGYSYDQILTHFYTNATVAYQG